MQLHIEQYECSGKTRAISLVMVAIRLVCVAVGFITGDTERTWANLLLTTYYMVLLAFSGVLYCAIKYVAQARLGSIILRVTQASMSVVQYAAIPLLTVLVAGVGNHGLYNRITVALAQRAYLPLDPRAPR